MRAIVTTYKCILTFKLQDRGLSGAVVTHLPPTTEVCGSKPGPYVGKLVVVFLMVSSVQKFDQLYVRVSSTHKTTCHDNTFIVLKAKLKPK